MTICLSGHLLGYFPFLSSPPPLFSSSDTDNSALKRPVFSPGGAGQATKSYIVLFQTSWGRSVDVRGAVLYVTSQRIGKSILTSPF